MELFNPLKLTGTFFVAQTYLQEKDFTLALEVFYELVQLYPESSWVSETCYHIGTCLERLNRLEEAQQSYEAVLKLGGNKPWIKFYNDRLEALSNLKGKVLSR